MVESQAPQVKHEKRLAYCVETRAPSVIDSWAIDVDELKEYEVDVSGPHEGGRYSFHCEKLVAIAQSLEDLGLCWTPKEAWLRHCEFLKRGVEYAKRARDRQTRSLEALEERWQAASKEMNDAYGG
jgi:hypothetical protein